MDVVDRMFELVDFQYAEQKEFAKDLGINPTTVSRWRNRKTESYRKMIAEIAIILNTTVEYLLNGTSSPVPKELKMLSIEEQQLIAAYREADKRAKEIVRLTLEPFGPSDMSKKAM